MIKVNNLSKSYGEIKAVQNISFRVKEGEIYAFLGENGAGKSTTINILCAILKKDKGDVFIGGNKLDAEDEKIKKILGVVFQGSFLDEALSVYENLAVRRRFTASKRTLEEDTRSGGQIGAQWSSGANTNRCRAGKKGGHSRAILPPQAAHT